MASGKAWEYFIPGWSAVRITQDVINAGKNYIDNRRASNTATTNRVNAAQSNLNSLKSQMPGEYKSEYGSQIGSTQDALTDLTKKGFSYDYTKDNAYQQYKNRYTRGAELASEDATAQAAGKTGGYGNSWASTNGQTAYQSTMAGLSNAVDDLYSQAFDEYTSKKNDLTTRLEALQKQEQLAQDAYNTKLNNYYSQLNNAQNEYADAVGEKQQNTANKTKFWGNVARVGAMVLPWVLRAMGVPI